MTEKLLSINGIDLHVTEVGSGEPLLVLHGLTVDATAAQREIEALADSYRVIAPDLRGHGRSTRPAGYTLHDHVTDMLALLDALKIDRVAVLGVSMGSYVAQALALAVPERVRKMILVVATSHGATSSSARVLAEHADEVRGLSRAEQQLWLGDRMFAPTTLYPVRQEVFDWFASRHRLGLAMTEPQIEAANRAVMGFDFRDALPGLDVPTLVVSGRHDIFNPRGRRANRRPAPRRSTGDLRAFRSSADQGGAGALPLVGSRFSRRAGG